MEDESLPIEADKVVALPLDELALLVLRDAKARGEWNWRNGVGHFRSAYAQRPDALQALAEAWSWLQSHGLIAGNYAQLSADAIMISRRGNAVLESGLGWLRAVERLDVDLVPVLEHKARPQFLRGDFETAAFVAMKEVEVQVRSLPVSLTAPAPSGSPGTTRLCRGCSRPPHRPVAQAASSFIPPLRRPDDGRSLTSTRNNRASWRTHMSVTTAMQRRMAAHHETQCDSTKTARAPRYAQATGRFRR